jgi:cell division protein FtsW (lipid II flippase)
VTLHPDAQQRRASERRLLAPAVLIAMFAYLLLGLSQSSQVPAGLAGYGSVLIAAAAVGHLVIRRVAPFADPILFPAAMLLNGLGLVFVRRVDFAENTSLATNQAVWVLVGIAAFAVTLTLVRSHRTLGRYHYTLGLITILLLLTPLLPGIGREINGARLWLRVGSFTFQPGEIAKLTMVAFLAGYLERKRALLSIATVRVGPFLLPPGRHLAPVLLAAGGAVLIVVVQRDLGSALLLLGTFVSMLYVATGRVTYPIIGAGTFAVGSVIAYQLFDHVQRRVQIWLDPWRDLNDAGYQLAQVTFALGTGGLTGTGLGLGRPDDIPFAATDAILAVIGEELGLLGVSALLALYLLMIGRGLRVAVSARDDVGTLLAAGLTTILGLQTFVIVGGLIRIMPFTGITLPFVSYGGSSLLANYVLLAVLLRISDTTRRLDQVGPSAGIRS